MCIVASVPSKARLLWRSQLNSLKGIELLFLAFKVSEAIVEVLPSNNQLFIFVLLLFDKVSAQPLHYCRELAKPFSGVALFPQRDSLRDYLLTRARSHCP